MTDKMRNDLATLKRLMASQRALSDRMLKQIEPHKDILNELLTQMGPDKTGEAMLMKTCLMIVIGNLTEAESQKLIMECTIKGE